MSKNVVLQENKFYSKHVDGLVQDNSASSALAMEILQSCTKPSMWSSVSIEGFSTVRCKISADTVQVWHLWG